MELGVHHLFGHFWFIYFEQGFEISCITSIKKGGKKVGYSGILAALWMRDVNVFVIRKHFPLKPISEGEAGGAK